jgi:methionyl-tRNA synthetase
VTRDAFYITTPIYYVNDVPHIGHAYTTVAADTLARYNRLKGRKVFFLTGTDEHGEKVQKSAAAQGLSPRELADRVVTRFQGLTPALDITNDDFIRTSEARHYEAVSKLFEISLANGDIYLGAYEGWYCTPCESFWTELQLLDGGLCPDCRRPADKRSEPSYFFRLSKYQQPLLDYYKANPKFIRPEARRNEVVSFVEGGLNDLSVSRTSLSWGIPVPGDPAHVIYVWYDALTNYLTGLGYPDANPAQVDAFWPADIHLVGKDIIKFHCVFWPAFLMSAGIAPPKGVFAHGWWTVEGQKMSKSLGNVVDPYEMVSTFGADAFRYFLLREVPFGKDGDFSRKSMVHRINADLSNAFGNLLNRTLGMLGKNFGGVVQAPAPEGDLDAALAAKAAAVVGAVDAHMNELEFSKALESIWELVDAANKYIDSTEPWKLAKDPEKRQRLGTVLYNALEAARLCVLLTSPVIPSAAQTMWAALGCKGLVTGTTLSASGAWGGLAAGVTLEKSAIAFPRIEEEKE